MQLSYIIAGMYCISLAYGALSGNLAEVSSAAVEGAQRSVELCLSLCGMVCLWSAVMELMSQSGLAAGLSSLLRPLLSRLFPRASRDRETMEALSENVSANLLGLGNAATPAGIRAARGMCPPGCKTASNELCLLVVMNTASIQLLPTTIASLRAALGAASPMDILPAVWLSSIVSVTAGIAAAKLLEKGDRHGCSG